MKYTKIVAFLSFCISANALAGPYYYGHRHHIHRAPHVVHHHHGHWVAPLIIGGVIGAAIAANRVEAQTQAPIVTVQPQPIINSAIVSVNELGQHVISCPAGLYPFESKAYVRNQFNQFVETTIYKCQ